MVDAGVHTLLCQMVRSKTPSTRNAAITALQAFMAHPALHAVATKLATNGALPHLLAAVPHLLAAVPHLLAAVPHLLAAVDSSDGALNLLSWVLRTSMADLSSPIKSSAVKSILHQLTSAKPATCDAATICAAQLAADERCYQQLVRGGVVQALLSLLSSLHGNWPSVVRILLHAATVAPAALLSDPGVVPALLHMMEQQ
jgi:hypothetical protein